MKTMAHSGSQMMHSTRQCIIPDPTTYHGIFGWTLSHSSSCDRNREQSPKTSSRTTCHPEPQRSISIYGQRKFGTDLYLAFLQTCTHSPTHRTTTRFHRTKTEYFCGHRQQSQLTTWGVTIILFASERKRPSHSCRTYTVVVFDIIVASPSTCFDPLFT